jgi:hypothetical protein
VNAVKFLSSLLIIYFYLPVNFFFYLISAAFGLSSRSSSLQSDNMWFTVCSPLLQEHTGLSRILYLCRYDLILPCPVTIAKFGVTLKLSFNLSTIFGKKMIS